MATKPAAGAGRDLIPSSRSRKALAKRLAAQAGRMSSAVIAEISLIVGHCTCCLLVFGSTLAFIRVPAGR